MKQHNRNQMTKRLIFTLGLIMLLLIGCSSPPEKPQAEPTDAATELPAETGETAVQDEPQPMPTEYATETPAETDNTVAEDEPQVAITDVTAQIQTKMDELTAEELLPGMVLWIDAPTYQFEGASGLANIATDSPMLPDGGFRIGSITKMFTAVVILQMAEDGVLTLDDPLALWLPEVAGELPHGDGITLRQLLAHTSGLFNVVEHEAYYPDIFTQMVVDETTGNVSLDCVQRDPNDTLARYVFGKDAQFEPGTQWRYSNTNYTLLGMIIEEAAGMPLAEAYDTYIYQPLGMTSTFLDCYEEPRTDTVHGYTGSGEAMADLTELHESVGWSAGGLVSTALDLVTFGRGLFDGALFDNPESLAVMTTPAPNSTNGLGIMLQADNMRHAGYIAGFRSVLTYIPKSDTIVVMLYNNDGADPELNLADVMEPALPMLDEAE